jgi:xanthine dehydrogenase accessory factor
MNKQILIWTLIIESLQKNIPVMLLYVLESYGSSPGRQGFFMAVNAGCQMEGSVGGGIMEHKFVEMAKAGLQEEDKEASVYKQIHDKAALKNQSGMICSGEQTIVLYKIQQKDGIHISNIISSLEKDKNGTLHLSPGGILFEYKLPAKNFDFNLKDQNNWAYIEKTGYKNYLYIVGGGHCALALSKMMSMMDFYITVFDEREKLNTIEKNYYAHEKKIIKEYTELSQFIAPGKNNYVVIMTFGYRSDDVAIRALLNKDFKYFGVLGSKNKMKKMFADYRKENIGEDILKKIHAPIGMQIKSETPEEIAISIAAEIIKIKNEI